MNSSKASRFSCDYITVSADDSVLTNTTDVISPAYADIASALPSVSDAGMLLFRQVALQFSAMAAFTLEAAH